MPSPFRGDKVMVKSLSELNELDVVSITGVASCPHGKQYTNLRATIATISNDGYFKVWPNTETEEDGGKIWFVFSECQVELIEKDTL